MLNSILNWAFKVFVYIMTLLKKTKQIKFEHSNSSWCVEKTTAVLASDYSTSTFQML